MMTALLIVHSLLAVALLGAITHQAFAAATKRAEVRKTSFLGRFRATEASGYRSVIVGLYAAVMVAGAILYPDYRLFVRPVLQTMDLRAANGSFELKEHFFDKARTSFSGQHLKRRAAGEAGLGLAEPA